MTNRVTGMGVLVGILVALHLIGWAISLGGVLAVMKEPRVQGGVLHGLYLALVTGLALIGVGLADEWTINWPWVIVKLVVTLVVIGLAIRGKSRPESVTRGYLGALAGLICVNVFLAILWR